ncbi:hypothetical protein VRK_35640 [Vibrio sp. MEBiC08052]|nr:hypothetical protein VRK_35640 [Vibrio sp. MEBiC08052]
MAGLWVDEHTARTDFLKAAYEFIKIPVLSEQMASPLLP